MWPFKKKLKDNSVHVLDVISPPHEHTWKDMPWYMDTEYDGSTRVASYIIVEPYICVTCGERINKILESAKWNNISTTNREEEYALVRKKYRKYLKPRAVVEDMINNILLVKDPDFLDMVETMRGLPHRGCGTSARMKPVNETNQPKLEEK